MKIAKGNVMNLAPASPGLVAVFDLGDGTETICPVIGWATVVQAHMNDGTVTTRVEPAFLWGEMVWTESELGEHSPGLANFQIRMGLFGDIPATA